MPNTLLDYASSASRCSWASDCSFTSSRRPSTSRTSAVSVESSRLFRSFGHRAGQSQSHSAHTADLRRIPSFENLRYSAPNSQLSISSFEDLRKFQPSSQKEDDVSAFQIIGILKSQVQQPPKSSSVPEALRPGWIGTIQRKNTRRTPSPSDILDALCTAFVTSASLQRSIQSNVPPLSVPSPKIQPFRVQTVKAAKHISLRELTPLKHIALTDTAYMGNAAFLETPFFPLSMKTLRLGSCRYLNLVVGDTCIDTVMQVAVETNPKAGARPEFWLEIKAPVMSLRGHSGDGKTWDLVGRVDLTYTIRSLMSEYIQKDQRGKWAKRLGLEKVSSEDYWLLHASHNTASSIYSVDEGPAATMQWRDEVDRIVRLVHHIKEMYQDFVIIKLTNQGGLEVTHGSQTVYHNGGHETLDMGRLTLRIKRNQDTVKVMVKWKDEWKWLTLAKVSDGRAGGTTWWVGFVVTAGMAREMVTD